MEAGSLSRNVRRALDEVLDAVVVCSAVRDGRGRIVDFRVEYRNPAAVDVAGRLRESFIGESVLAAFPARARRRLLGRFLEVLDTGEALVQTAMPYTRTVGGRLVRRVYDVRTAKFGDGLMMSWRDVTEYDARNRELEDMRAALEVAQRIANIGSWRWDAATGEVTGSEQLYRMAARPGPFTAAEVLERDDDLRRQLHAARERVVRDREPFVLERRRDLPDGTERTLLIRGEPVFGTDRRVVAVQGTTQDVTELRAAYSAIAERDMQLAAEQTVIESLQHAVLPSDLPHVDGVEVAARYLPAHPGLRVGGDWYDVTTLNDGRLAIAVGDVAGHGVHAASLMGQFRAAKRAYMAEGHDIATVFQNLNRFIARYHPAEFATALLATYVPERHELEWGRAGHPPALLFQSGVARFLEDGGSQPLGVDPGTHYVTAKIHVDAEATVVFYTDGLVEHRDGSIEDGMNALASLVAGNHSLAVDKLCDEILAACVAPNAEDDICVVVARIQPAPPRH